MPQATTGGAQGRLGGRLSAGSRANSTGPEAALASAALVDAKGRALFLDDGEEHCARIVLERNRFRDPRLAKASGGNGRGGNGEDDGNGGEGVATGATVAGSAYRLLVYVDSMQSALINLEVHRLYRNNLPR